MRAKGHKITGVLVGGTWDIVEWWHKKQTNPQEPFPLGKFILYTGTGYFLASLLDWIEPSKGNPNHRQFFHSASFVVVLVAIQHSDWLKVRSSPMQAVIRAAIFQYLVHVGADALTTRSIPLVHTRFA
jgi:membrane-bound metal-dependent hydrolase YbcI (DUF457 family)